jgi:two-component system, NarL family, invasion response regulator UvrY
MNHGLPRAGLSVLLVDEHTVVREGLRRVLEGCGEGWTVVEAASGFQALERLREQPIAVVITDLSMPGMNGLELIRRVRSEYADIAILVLSMHAEDQYALRAFKSGANGYVTKDSAAAELVSAVRKVAEGGVYVTGSLAERVVKQLSGKGRSPGHVQLSDRELDVLRRLVAGQRLTDIAQELHLSVKTVSTHKTHIQEKLQLPNLAALVRYGLENQLDKDGPSSGFGVV